MKYLTGSSKKLKVGARYYFVNTNFDYADVRVPIIKQRTVYRIVTGDFSTKEPGDMYEVERTMAFETEDEAKKYALKELRRYKKYLNEKVDKAIKLLAQQKEENLEAMKEGNGR